MIGDFAGRTVLVTGGGRGVGRAIVRLFAARGAHVIVNYFHSRAAATALVGEITGQGGSAEAVSASVAKPEQVREMFASLAFRHDGLDVLVNNAARGTFGGLDELGDDDWNRALDTNLHGARWCARAALPLLSKRPGGCIINVSSLGGGHVVDQYAMVGVSKAALEALTRYQAGEYAEYGVRVNAVASGLIDNAVAEMFRGADTMKRHAVAATPVGRMTSEEDLARAVLLLASPEAGWVTGQTLVADGGLTLGRALFTPPAEHKETPRSVPTRARRAGPREDPVAVVGMGVKLPGVNGPEEFWDVLHRSEPVFSEPGERFRLQDFWSTDPDMPDKTYVTSSGVIHDANPTGAAEDFQLTWLREVLDQARSTTTTQPDDRHGVFVGGWIDGSQHLEESMVVNIAATQIAARHGADRAELLRVLSPRYRYASLRPRDCMSDVVVRRAIRGLFPDDTPCLTVDTACSSSLYSLDLGVKALLDNEIDIAYCGGGTSFGPRYLVLFAKLNGLSPTTDVRAFDEAANGTVFSDGAGAVALKRLSKARADGDDVLAVLSGFGAAADGRGAAIYAPNTTGQSLALRRARSVNNLLSHQIDLVVAHGTGTVAGDGVELESISAEALSREMVCVSNKSVVGHAGWAAGVVSVVHALLCLRYNKIPAQQRFSALSNAGKPVSVHIPVTDLPFAPHRTGCPRTIGVSAFGFGGTNAHLILQDPPQQTSTHSVSAGPASEDDLVLVAWTAERRPAGAGHPDLPFADVHMSRTTMRSIDRCHLMALSAVARFSEQHGPLWTGVEHGTGVIAAHRGVPRSSVDATLRCYATGLREVFSGRPEETACGEFLDELCARVPETTEDTLPGVMPNVIPARIANRYDLHGPTMTFDSGLAALYAAAGCLRRAELDLALVLGVHGNSTPDMAELLETELAEGVVLLAVARRATAQQRKWPVLAKLDAALRSSTERLASRTPSYGAADPLMEIVEALDQPHPVVIHGDVPGPGVTVTPVRARTAQLLTQRHRVVFREQQRPATNSGFPPLPQNCLVLAESAELLDRLAGPVRRADAVLISPTSETRDVEEVVGDLADVPRHIRLFASLHDAAWPEQPTPGLLALQEMLFLAVQHSHARLDSLAVVLLDPLRDGTPHPHSGLFSGFVKSLVWELPACDAFALLTTSTGIDQVLAEVAAESARHRDLPVIHLRYGNRFAEQLEPIPDRSPDDLTVRLGPESVIVAPGGSRGLTAAILSAIAEKHRPWLWILGSTDFDSLDTTVLTASADELRTRRSRFIAERRTAEPDITVAELAYRFDRLIDANEAWHNLARLRELCGPDRVRYLCCDITDPAAVREAAQAIKLHNGRIDLLVNGAGLHKATGVETKTLRDFRRIRDVKVRGYHNLRLAFTDPAPSRWCNFGSLVGVTGLPGETDYAPANELLSIAARRACLTAPDEYTIGWTIWAETGMGVQGLTDSFVQRRRHLSLISNAEGIEHFLGELNRPRTAEDAVVTLIGAQERATLAEQFPDLRIADHDRSWLYLGLPNQQSQVLARWTLLLDPSDDPVLANHLVDGRPTLPGMFALEVAAEAALNLVPDHRVQAFRNITFEAFIHAPKEGPKRYAVTATVVGRNADKATVRVEITSDVTHNGQVLRRNRSHAHIDVITTSKELPSLRTWTPWPPGEARAAIDPYYQPGSPAYLTGFFRNTIDPRITVQGAAARFLADQTQMPDRLKRAVIPALMLDALGRCAWLPTADTRPGVAIPRYIDEIRLYTGKRDIDLTEGVDLFADAVRCTAVTPAGEVIAEIEGITSVVLESPAALAAH